MDSFDNKDLTDDGRFGGHGDEVHEKMDAIENVVGLLDTAIDAVKVQSHKLSSVLPAQKLRRLVSVPYTLTSDYLIGEHRSLVRAAAELLPVVANGRVCVHYSLLNTAPRYESNTDSSSLVDMIQMLEETNGPELGIAQRCEYYGSPKCPTVSPSSDIRPKGMFEPITSTMTDCSTLPSTSIAEAISKNESGSEKQRILSLENELKALKEQLLMIAKLRGLDKGIDNARGSPPPEPSTSTSGFIPAPPPLPPPPPPPTPIPLILPRLSIAQNAKNLDVDSQPSQTLAVPSMKDILKDLNTAKDKLKPVPFTKSPGGTPLCGRRRSGGSRFSGQSVDHGTLIAEALRKKFASINGDQSPQRVSESRGDDEWNSSFDDTPTGTPHAEGDGRKVSITRVSRRSLITTPQKMHAGDNE